MSGEFILDTAAVRSFVDDARTTIAAAPSPEEACEALRPLFAELLADPDWLPTEYRADAPDSGMGGGIGQWLLYRAEDHSLSLFSLVVPPGSATPIHDHLAWGLVGLYRGEQDEEIYARRAGVLELVEQRALVPGDFYVLLPPRDDIHRVRTTSAETSVSIHLLTNDTGCVWRHSFDPASGEERPFRSGYVNVPCEDEEGRVCQTALMELDDGYVWITTRKLKHGSREEFSRSWKPSEFPAGMLRAYELYSPDGNEVVGISVWDSAESRDAFRKSEVESERRRAMAPYVLEEVSGFYVGRELKIPRD